LRTRIDKKKFGSSANEEERQEEEEEEEVLGPQIPRRSTRIRNNKKACQLPCCQRITCSERQYCDEYADEPKNARSALSGNNRDKWFEAMSEEVNMLKLNKVWEVVGRPKNQNVIGSKWVLKTKRNQTNEIERYKARLVAQGFSQVPGKDFDETYSPVVLKDTEVNV